MSKPTYYVEYDASGVITGTGYTPDGTLPQNSVSCTQQVAENPNGYSVSKGALVSPTAAQKLQYAKDAQIATLSESFQSAALSPVTDANGVQWNGGESSALSIDGAIRLAQNSGATSVDLWDYANTKHTLTIAEAQAVAAAVGGAFQTAYAKWQTLRAQVVNATTVSAVQAIVW
jgi:hypothetical protein